MKFSHFVPNKISYTMICILLFSFLSKFYVIFTKFLKVSRTRKYFIKFSACRTKFHFNNWRMEQFIFVSVHVLGQEGCRTPMTIYKLEKPWFLLHWLGTNFCWVLPQLFNVLPWVLICLSSNFNWQCFRD